MAGFPDGVPWSLAPSGPTLTLSAGPLEGRVFESTGHIQLAGPNLAGAALANVMTLAPPAVLPAQGAALQLGRVVASSVTPNALTVTHAAGDSQVTATLSFVHDGVLRYEVTDWGAIKPAQTALAGASPADEHFYGFGEKFDVLDQAGKRVDVLTFDNPGTKGDRSYKVAPWFVSTRGYGLHLDSSAEVTFDLRAGAADRFVVVNRFPTLAVNLVYGPKLVDVLSRYTGYAGRPAVPPPWYFGPWISSDVWRSGGEVRYAVAQFAQRRIPASAFVFDSPWETAYNDFRFNMTQFGADATIEGVHYPGFTSVADMMEFLRANGLKAILWMAPFVNVSSNAENIAGQNLGQAATYPDGHAKGVFVRAAPGGAPLVVPWWKGRGSPIDFTNPAATDWVTAQLQQLIDASRVTTASGGAEPVIGGFKTDDGESGNGTDTYIPATAAYADGRTGVEMRNGYCLTYQRAIWNVLAQSGALFARSGFVGSQAFPGSWAGDNEPNFGDNGLPGVIVAGQSAAMSGYAVWGHDVGGYQDTNFSKSPPNLFMRWAQFGCFSPIMQMHRQVTRGLQYPWRYGDQALANYRTYTRLHTRLFPYIYTYAHRANQTGVPIIRPLVLLDQADPNTFAVEHAYRFGDELLVAPILEPNATSRAVYLPAGDWFDFWTNQAHTGGQLVTWTNADQTKLPVFVRSGALIPMLMDDVRTLCDADYVNNPAVSTSDGGWLVQVYPGGDSTFTAYDETVLACTGDQQAGAITVTSTPRRVQLRILADPPQSVTSEGAALAFQYDAATNTIDVEFAHSGGAVTIRYQ